MALHQWSADCAEAPGGAAADMNTVAIQEELVRLITTDLARQGIVVYDPLPNAPSAQVLPHVAPIQGNVLIPLGQILSRARINLQLLVPGL